MKQIITLSDNAALRIKEIMSKAENNAVGVRVGVKSGGCAGMSYIMEYTKQINPNDEIIEEKGVKQYPMRVKCATLSWHTLTSAIDNFQDEINTENMET